MKQKIFYILKLMLGLIFPLFLYIYFYEIEIWGIDKYFTFIFLFAWLIPMLVLKNYNHLLKILVILNILLLFILLNFINTYSLKISIPIMEKNLEQRQDNLKSKIIETLSYHNNYDIKNVNDYIDKYKKEDEFLPLLKCFYITSIEWWRWYIIAYKYISEETIKEKWKDYFLYQSINDYTISNDNYNEIEKTLKNDCINNFFNEYYVNIK